jgi:hypothetical protein
MLRRDAGATEPRSLARPTASASASSRASSRPRRLGWPATCARGPSRRPARPIPETSFCMLAWEGGAARQVRGDGQAEARYAIGVNCDLCGNGSALAAGGESAGKHPGAGGNIGGRQRAELLAQDFDLFGWRCGCCGSGDVAVAQHTARSCPAEMPGRAASTAGFGTMASPKGSRSCARPAATPRGTGERCTLARAGGKERCCACKKIKLPVKEFGTDRTARDGHARAATCAAPQPEQ